ncbi:MAG: hypothetical protein ACREH8_00190 [Opitutaceae bacterium]
MFFTDIPNSKAYKIGLDSRVTLARENTSRDGRLYVATHLACRFAISLDA